MISACRLKFRAQGTERVVSDVDLGDRYYLLESSTDPRLSRASPTSRAAPAPLRSPEGSRPLSTSLQIPKSREYIPPSYDAPQVAPVPFLLHFFLRTRVCCLCAHVCVPFVTFMDALLSFGDVPLPFDGARLAVADANLAHTDAPLTCWAGGAAGRAGFAAVFAVFANVCARFAAVRARRAALRGAVPGPAAPQPEPEQVPSPL